MPKHREWDSDELDRGRHREDRKQHRRNRDRENSWDIDERYREQRRHRNKKRPERDL